MIARLALVSIGIRRDLLTPLRYFSKFELTHMYRYSAYGDLEPEDFDSTLHPYTTPLDLYRQLVTARPTVIQSVEPFSYYTQPLLLTCYLAARKLDASLLVVTHENRPLEIKFGKVRAEILKQVLKAYFTRACLVHAQNNRAKQNVLDCGAPPSRVVRGLWGAWGVDTQEFSPRAVPLSDAPPTILFAGRLHPEKGVLVLIDAFALLQKRLPTSRLRVAGSGPARAALMEKIKQFGLAESVTLLGTVKHRAMPQVFQTANVFCAPSITTRKWAEQAGIASLQAMACGVPVVSTRSGSIPEFIPDGIAGVLVQEQDADELANALFSILSSPRLAAEMGQRGREYACAHYDARTNVQIGEQLVWEHCVARGV